MVKVGIIGFGIRGQLFARTIQDNPHAEVVGVADLKEDMRKVAAGEFSLKVYDNYEAMMDEAKPDMVVVSTPDSGHKAPVLAAAKRGMHVMVEKPMATSYEEAQEMAEAVKKAGVKLMVAFENRWNPPFVAVKEAIGAGRVGEIQAMNVRLNDTIFVPTKMLPWINGNSSPAWFLQSHMIDMACWLSGKKAAKVYAAGSKKILPALGVDSYDTIQTLLTFTDGTSVSVSTSWILPDGQPTVFDGKFEIIGDKGGVNVDLVSPMTSVCSPERHDVIVTDVVEVDGKMYGGPCYMLNSFIDSVRLGVDAPVSLEEGLENTRILDALHKSAATGEIIKL